MKSAKHVDYLYYQCRVIRQGSPHSESFILTVQSEQELYDYCQRRNFSLLNSRLLSRYSPLLLWEYVSQSRMSLQELIHFCEYLSHVLESGITFLDALEEYALYHQSLELKKILREIIDDIQHGTSIANSFAKYPHLFDSAFTGLIQVAEETGQLSVIFKELADNLKWQSNILQKTKQALTYPAMVFITMTGTLLFLLSYTVPQLVEFIKSANTELSFSTQLLIGLGNLVQNHLMLLFSIPFVLIFIILLIKWRYPLRFETLLFKIPIFGIIFRHLILARCSYLLQLLYKSGIPLLESLSIVSQSIPQKTIQNQMNTIHTQIKNGKGITDSFLQENFFNPLLTPLIRMGENTGRLDQALSSIYIFYSNDIDSRTAKIYTMAQPVLTAILGIILIWIISSVIAPIYDLILKV